MKLRYPRPGDRNTHLDVHRSLKMAKSAHAYVRGSTVKFYEWLAQQRRGVLPEGPAIWICGDCHAGNLGPISDASGKIEIQVRDFDQTVIGNPAHDLIRLGLSLATAARGSDLPGVTTAKIMEQLVEGYEQSLAQEHGDKADRPDTVRIIMRRSVKRSWKHLAQERIENTKPTIPLGDNFWPASRIEASQIGKIFETAEARKLATMLKSRKDEAPLTVLDAAYWRKGCSSLGLLRFAVLLRVGKKMALMDIKEAVNAAAPRYPKQKMPQNNAERVVEGARNLSPFLGERMLATDLLDRPVFVRELLPQDLKLEFDVLTRDEAMNAAHFLAGVVGKAHARQMDAPTRKSWQTEIGRHRSKSLDAPSWLWSSIVQLISSHEAAYLEHCRRYAAEAA